MLLAIVAIAIGGNILFDRAVFRLGVVACLAVLASCVSPANAAAANFTVRHFFRGGEEGKWPMSGVIADGAGNLYGTTYVGAGELCHTHCGTAYRLAPDGTMNLLHVFRGGGDGESLASGLVADKSGNLFGTAVTGGNPFCNCGVVFRIAPDGTETVLHAFKGGSTDGEYPHAGLLFLKGKLYGTTELGGAHGRGTVFRLAPGGTMTLLYSFGGDPKDGYLPNAGVIADAVGALYGTTTFGGAGPDGGGTIFKIAPDGTGTLLHSFQGGSDGLFPRAGLVMDAAGNLYGTTEWGGSKKCAGHYGCGVVFRLAPDGTETVLHAFSGKSDGYYPEAGLVIDAKGNLYGTASQGGTGNCLADEGCGVVFKLAPGGHFTVLHTFAGSLADGAHPYGELMMDAAGTLRGTTRNGGIHDKGALFKLENR
jgi:uncharacterized repeat protein (TIGR03803 family)